MDCIKKEKRKRGWRRRLTGESVTSKGIMMDTTGVDGDAQFVWIDKCERVKKIKSGTDNNEKQTRIKEA